MFNQIKNGCIEIPLFLPFICYHKTQIISMCQEEKCGLRRSHVTWEALRAPMSPQQNINYFSNLTSRAVTMRTSSYTCSNKNLINIFVDMENSFFFSQAGTVAVFRMISLCTK